MASERTCWVIRAGEASRGVTGVNYARGISATTVGAQALCLQLAVLPPGARAKAHSHKDHESAVYVISGHLILWFGEGLREKAVAGPGDFVYIPPEVPHLPMNLSKTEPAVTVLARTDPNEQESATPLPELDALNHLSTEVA